MDREILADRIKTLLSEEYDVSFKNKYRVKNSSGYKMIEKLKGKIFDDEHIQTIQYRPFDYQWIYYEPGLISRPAFLAIQHIYQRENLVLLASRSFPANQVFDRVFVTRNIPDIHSASDQTYVFPLYLYTDETSRTTNLKKEIVSEIENACGKISPENIFDYIYAALHSPSYREKYKEFLKIDFPRVPYPKDTKTFKKLVAFGAELRSLHLLESPKVNQFITTYPIAGSDTVEKLAYKNGKVFINTEQYFGNVPEVIWNFYIGGYQPARKWLKDRKGRALTNTDIEHYQKIIVALAETNRIMKEIDSNIYF
jgi:predicted helicase